MNLYAFLMHGIYSSIDFTKDQISYTPLDPPYPVLNRSKTVTKRRIASNEKIETRSRSYPKRLSRTTRPSSANIDREDLTIAKIIFFRTCPSVLNFQAIGAPRTEPPSGYGSFQTKNSPMQNCTGILPATYLARPVACSFGCIG